MPQRVLFVCHGNICRSPYAHGSFKRRLPGVMRGRIAVESAGFVGAGRACPSEAILVAGRRGVDLSGHRARPLTIQEARAAEIVFVMDAAQRRALCYRLSGDRVDIVILGDLDPQPIDTRAITDPLDGSPEVFEDAYARIDRCVAAIVGVMLSGADGSARKDPRAIRARER